MSVTPILPVAGVPDELIRILNDRFRQVTGTGLPVTPNVGGSLGGLFFAHANRPDANAQAIGTYGTETDRGVVYQVQTVRSQKTWVYVSGTMSAVVASRPADLGTNDAGFLFLATDTFQQFRWSGSAWVEVTQANLAQLAYASADLTISSSYQDVTGATITLTRAGRHLITGVFDLLLGSGDSGLTLFGQLVADGAAQSQVAAVTATNVGTRWMASQQWLYTASATGKVVKLQVKRSSGAGTNSIAEHPGTSISALWVGP
jgi:hypothetical protein